MTSAGRLRRALFLGPLRAARGRLALALAAIALGVALGYAVQLVNQSAMGEFARGVQTLSGTADLELRGPRAGFDEALYPRVARLPEVAVASPVIEADVRPAGREGTLRLVGLDVFRAGLIQPDLVAASSADALDVLRPDTIFLSPAAAEWLGVTEGDTLALQIGLGEARFRVAGLTRADGTRFGIADIAGVQAALDRPGRINRLDLRLRAGVDVEAFRVRLAAELPPGVLAERPAAGIQRAANISRSYRVNLNVLALVALFTGGLLVFSTQALAVVRRRPQLALLRVLGMTRGRLVRTLLGEALVLGAAGAALGLLAGFALAQGVLGVVGPDLGAGTFRGIRPALRFEPGWAAAFFGLGVGVALLASLAPALEAARAQPAAALKAGDEQRVFARLKPAWPGLAMIAAGAMLTTAPPIEGLPLFGYGAIALLLIGTIMLMPRVAAAAFARLPAHRAAPLRLAAWQLRGAPGQSMVSLATIVAAVSLLVSMAIMVASFRHSLGAWLDHVLPADLYVRTSAAADTAFLAPQDQAALGRLPGVRRADFARIQSLLLAPGKPPVTLLARPIDPQDPGRLLPLVGGAAALSAGAPPPAWVSEAMVDVYGFTPGVVIELPIGGQRARFTVAGVWRDYVRQHGSVVIERDRYVTLTGDRNASDAALWLADGADAGAVRQAIRAALPGGESLEIAAPGEIRERSMQAFDRTFAITYVLELVALAIGLTGLSSAFGALVLARRSEFGVLRYLGLTRRQIGAMLAAEGFAVSALGLAVGLALGAIISLILIHVVNRQSFHWSMDLAVPWAPLAAFCAVMLAAAAVTATVSARAAMAGDAVRAVKEDW
jgi:putative ABC transport system permease protein